MNMMRTSLCAILLVTAAGFQRAGREQAFTGKWNLEIGRSVNLPASFAMVKSFTMDVAGAPDSLVVTNHLSGSGQEVSFPPTIYRLDSSEVYREDTLRGSKRWIRASMLPNGSLSVWNRVVQGRGPSPQRYHQTDIWRAQNRDTLVLLVERRYDERDSVSTEKRIFSRMRK